MRTTIRLPDDLLREAKKQAADQGIPLTRLVEDALRESLSRAREPDERPEPVSFTTVRGSGVNPGVDLDDSASLVDLMEGSNDPS